MAGLSFMSDRDRLGWVESYSWVESYVLLLLVMMDTYLTTERAR